jgi:beta-ureidopropionase
VRNRVERDRNAQIVGHGWGERRQFRKLGRIVRVYSVFEARAFGRVLAGLVPGKDDFPGAKQTAEGRCLSIRTIVFQFSEELAPCTFDSTLPSLLGAADRQLLLLVHQSDGEHYQGGAGRKYRYCQPHEMTRWELHRSNYSAFNDCTREAARNCHSSVRLYNGPNIRVSSLMPRILRCSLIQAANAAAADLPLEEVKRAMIDKHVDLIAKAAAAGSKIVCLQEIFYGPYFCAEQQTRWYDFTERVPDGTTVKLMQDLARKHSMALIVPVYEVEQEGVYYNTAAVIAADGSYLGKYRKTHIPHVAPGFWEKFYFRPGNLGYPTFDLGVARIGVYICYDRHFPEGARALGLNGAEIVFNPSATVAGLSEYLWKLEQPAHAVANGYYVGAINRVGVEAPWNIGEFYGSSYFCNPRGQIIAQASRDRDEVLTADLDLDMIGEVRKTWQFFRDRRPDMYESLVKA